MAERVVGHPPVDAGPPSLLLNRGAVLWGENREEWGAGPGEQVPTGVCWHRPRQSLSVRNCLDPPSALLPHCVTPLRLCPCPYSKTKLRVHEINAVTRLGHGLKRMDITVAR